MRKMLRENREEIYRKDVQHKELKRLLRYPELPGLVKRDERTTPWLIRQGNLVQFSNHLQHIVRMFRRQCTRLVGH